MNDALVLLVTAGAIALLYWALRQYLPYGGRVVLVIGLTVSWLVFAIRQLRILDFIE